jgi:hypothetical protein
MYLLVFWPYCVFGQNHLCVKDAVHRDSTFSVMSRPEEIQVPCQPSERCVIPSGSSSVYCSIRSDDVLSCPDARQTSIIRPDDVPLPSEHSTVSRSFCSSLLRPDVSAASPDAHQHLISHRFFPSSKEGKINQPFGRCGIPSGRVSP